MVSLPSTYKGHGPMLSFFFLNCQKWPLQTICCIYRLKTSKLWTVQDIKTCLIWHALGEIFYADWTGCPITQCKTYSGNVQSLSVVNVLNLQNKVEKKPLLLRVIYSAITMDTHHVGMWTALLKQGVGPSNLRTLSTFGDYWGNDTRYSTLYFIISMMKNL